jgi:FkbM family methyltransferase
MKLPILSQTLALHGHTFLRSALTDSSVVVDLGANAGEFSRKMVHNFHCRCIAVEPNPSMLERIRELSSVELAWTAIGDCDGHIELYLSDNPEASTTLPGSRDANGQKIRVPTSTLAGLLKKFGLTHVDLMKVDIEGSEVQMILSAPDHVLQSIDQISVEFHDFCNLVTPKQVADVHARLKRLNFDAIAFGSGNEDSLFVRRDAAGIGRIRRIYVKHVVHKVCYVSRLARRTLRRFRRIVGTPPCRSPSS